MSNRPYRIVQPLKGYPSEIWQKIEEKSANLFVEREKHVTKCTSPTLKKRMSSGGSR